MNRDVPARKMQLAAITLKKPKTCNTGGSCSAIVADSTLARNVKINSKLKNKTLIKWIIIAPYKLDIFLD